MYKRQAIWKVEHVTVIPKCSIPQSINDLRNISCTLLASKVMESYLLEWLSSEVKLGHRQYGGVKGCGAPHLLSGRLSLDIWRTAELRVFYFPWIMQRPSTG